MKPLIETPPRTLMEVFKSLPEGTLAELIDNQLYMSPSPAFNHQKTVQEIFRKLCTAITDKARGEVIIAPFDVYLDEVRNAVQPDIVVILSGNPGTLNQNGHFHGVPDLLVEILSPANRDYDLIKKRDLYERFGVAEYWIIDPDTKLAMVFVLQNGKYKMFEENKATIKSVLLKCDLSF